MSAAYRRRPLQNAGKRRELLGKLHEKPFDFISFVLVTPISTRSSVLGGNFCDPSNEARTCRRSLREILILKGFFAKNRVFCLFFVKRFTLDPTRRQGGGWIAFRNFAAGFIVDRLDYGSVLRTEDTSQKHCERCVGCDGKLFAREGFQEMRKKSRQLLGRGYLWEPMLAWNRYHLLPCCNWWSFTINLLNILRSLKQSSG